MSDATFKGPTPAQPVSMGTLPSRAAGEPTQQPAPMFDAPTAPNEKMARRRAGTRKGMATKAAKRAGTHKPVAKKTQAVSRKEAAALAAKRKAALLAKRRADRAARKPTAAAVAARQRVASTPAPAPVAPKNPNRPLEMKNQLQAVIAMTGVLTKAELTLFAQIVGALQAVSRNSRRDIIAGLKQVYG